MWQCSSAYTRCVVHPAGPYRTHVRPASCEPDAERWARPEFRSVSRAGRPRHLRRRPPEVLRAPRGREGHRLRGRRAARSSGSSAPTAPARRPPSRSSRATARAPPARRPCSASIRPADPGVARAIGLVLQESEVDPVYTVREIVGMFSHYYRSRATSTTRSRSSACTKQRDTRVGQLSGGQKRRVDVALGIVGDPDLVFLDEPTTGFDPQARRDAWNMIRGSARARQDRPADHALHGRGAAPRRPTHHPPRRRGRRARARPRSSPSSPAAEPSSASGSRRASTPTDASRRSGIAPDVSGSRVTLRTEPPQHVLYRLTGWAERRARRARGPRGEPPDARRRLPRADGPDRRRGRGRRERPGEARAVSDTGLVVRQAALRAEGHPPQSADVGVHGRVPGHPARAVQLRVHAARTARRSSRAPASTSPRTSRPGSSPTRSCSPGSVACSSRSTTNRERGLLKRYRGTPMPPWVFLGGQILQTIAMILIMAVVLIAIGVGRCTTSTPRATPIGRARSSTSWSGRRRCARSASR